MDDILVLGIESTAHTFGVGIASTRKPHILSNIYSTYTPEKGGIHPREASRHHVREAPRVVREALSAAGVTIRDITAVAVALGPGLGPCLRVGASIARAIAAYYNKPLIPVNHAVAHIEIGRLITSARDPVILYLSGGNTLVSAYNKGRYRVFGETLDIALGNLFDTFAREVGLAPPYVVSGRHQVDICAEQGRLIEDEIPYIVKGQDLSFSGLLTASLRLLEKRRYKLSDICYTLRETAYSMVLEVTERCLAHTGKKEVLVVGGVAASPYLREKIEMMAKTWQAKSLIVPPEYARDNGAMIAWTGLLAYMHNITIKPEEAVIRQRWRLDEVDIPWYEHSQPWGRGNTA